MVIMYVEINIQYLRRIDLDTLDDIQSIQLSRHKFELLYW